MASVLAAPMLALAQTSDDATAAPATRAPESTSGAEQRTPEAAPPAPVDLSAPIPAAPDATEKALAETAGRGPPEPNDRCPQQTITEPRRRAPSVTRSRVEDVPCNPSALPEPLNQLREGEGLPDRWRMASILGYRQNLLDPYHGNNWLKGDSPAFGEDWFVSLIGISDTIVEPRRFPVPVGGTATANSGSNDTLGDGDQIVLSQSFALETVLYRGDTVFKPPDYEFRFTPVFNISYVDTKENGLVKSTPTFGTSRTDNAVGVQAFFIDKHLRNVSDRFDFDSIRIGIQPFTTDFRGFLFQDSPIGVRLFGTRGNNRYQYNLAAFRRIEKDTNSGLNDVSRGGDALRDDDIFVANLYVQDFPTLGFTSQGIVLYNRNREGDDVFADDNGVIQRPSSLGLGRGSDYDVYYAGYNGDGHFGRWNVTTSLYAAVGSTERGMFVDRSQDIRAGFAALEVSRDYSWARVRASAAYATADDNPFDDRATGFDAIFENPLIAGADTSFYIRQPIPLIGGGRVSLSGRNAFLNSLRPSKEFGQSNFVNPGLLLAGVGLDFDLSPTLRVSSNVNYLAFVDTAVLEVARQQAPIDRQLGIDASLALTWRPRAIQNIVGRLSIAALVPGSGYEDLFGDDFAYSVLGNVVLTY